LNEFSLNEFFKPSRGILNDQLNFVKNG
jgi:hypothetical protein